MATVDLYGLVGQVLDGQFRVDRVIGEGGFSIVYHGLHVGLDEPVAVKCLKLPAQLGSAVVEGLVRRFRDESKIHYRLSRGSLHIARTIAAGTTMAPAIGALVPYMVLEWLEGYTLAEELRARSHRGESGRSLAEVIRLLDPVAEAMAFAHAQGVVHRDLNPSNIFVAHTQGAFKLKVLDFGVAKVISDHALSLGPRAATLGQIRMFTPAYAAPEQFHEPLGAIATETDVYSFAVLVVELLADKTPVEGEHLGEYADRALDPARRPTPRAMGIEVGDAVEAVMARAVSVDPARRPKDIGEFWGMLKHAVQVDQKNRAGEERGYPNPPLAAAPSFRGGFRGRTSSKPPIVEPRRGGVAETLLAGSVLESKPTIEAAGAVWESKDNGGAVVARVIDIVAAPETERRESAAPPPPVWPGAGTGPSRPSAPYIPEAERPRWHAPSVPKEPDAVVIGVPAKGNIHLLVALAIGLTVTFVLLAIVATELSH